MKLAVGIDMGGTKIQGILMDEKGSILKKYRRPTEGHKSKKKILANIIAPAKIHNNMPWTVSLFIPCLVASRPARYDATSNPVANMIP